MDFWFNFVLVRDHTLYNLCSFEFVEVYFMAYFTYLISINYLFVYNKLPQHLMASNENHLFAHSFSGSRIWEWHKDGSGLGSLMRLQLRYRLGLQSSEGFTEVGGFTSKITHLHSCCY